MNSSCVGKGAEICCSSIKQKGSKAAPRERFIDVLRYIRSIGQCSQELAPDELTPFTSEDICGGPGLLEAQPVVRGQQGFQLLGSGHVLADLRKSSSTESSVPQCTHQLVLRDPLKPGVALTFCLRASLR